VVSYIKSETHQWLYGDVNGKLEKRDVRTSEVMGGINAHNNEHRKDLQYKGNSNDESNNLFIVSRAAVIRTLHRTFDL
jgi:hypothetical protein